MGNLESLIYCKNLDEVPRLEIISFPVRSVVLTNVLGDALPPDWHISIFHKTLVVYKSKLNIKIEFTAILFTRNLHRILRTLVNMREITDFDTAQSQCFKEIGACGHACMCGCVCVCFFDN